MEVGVHVWLFLPTGWKRGIIKSRKDRKLQVNIDEELHAIELPTDGKYKRIQFAGTPAEDDSVLPTDLSSLEHANEPSMLETLDARYSLGKIYTYAGSTLLSINPFEATDLYSAEIMSNYTIGLNEEDTNDEPHVYQLSMTALKRMLIHVNRNQTIVISGESGAGKSETTKYIMGFLAHLSTKLLSEHGRRTSSGADAKRRVLESSPILESFGNAMTTKNENSSRFGKYVQLQFSAQEGLAGAMIETCLLEKVRIVSHSKGERNFHIFYEMCAGLDAQAKKFYRITKPEDFFYLNQGKEVDCSRDDAANFIRTCEAINAVGFKDDEKSNLFKILAGILHMGQMKLEESPGADERHSVKLVDTVSMQIAAAFFGIDAYGFQDVICSKIIQAGGDTVSVELTAEQAIAARDALAKEIYSKTFTWIVQRINESVMYDKAPMFFGILDIFGFEVFDNNSLEQLCINYANEKLQNLYIETVIAQEQQAYRAEKVSCVEIDVSSVEERVKLFEAKPFGVLPLLDETCLMPKGTDSSLVNKLNMCCRENPYYVNIRLQRNKSKLVFIIKHFAAEVTYNATGFCAKNADQINSQAISMLEASRNRLLYAIFYSIPDAPSKNNLQRSASGTRIARSLTVQFRDQLESLLATIRSTETNFIRCLKPNEKSLPKKFEGARVGVQLSSSGILDAVTIARTGYPIRVLHQLFVYRYQALLPKGMRPTAADMESNDRAILCKDLLLEILCGNGVLSVKLKETFYGCRDGDFQKLNEELFEVGFQLGLTKVYMKNEGYQALEKLMGNKELYYTIVVQTRYRKIRAQRELGHRRWAAYTITEMGREHIVGKKMVDILDEVSLMYLVHCFTLRCASLKLTRQGRYFVDWLRLRERSAISIQASMRRKSAYILADILRHRRDSAILIQSTIRQYFSVQLVRRIHEKRRTAAIHIQCLIRRAIAITLLNALRRRRDLEIYSATIIQSSIRRKLAYNEHHRLYELHVIRTKCAIVIQCAIRCFLARKMLLSLGDEYDYMIDCVYCIQSVARMYIARQELKRRRVEHERLRSVAASMIQRKFWIYRCRVLCRERREAAIIIASLIRQLLAVRRVEEMRRKALIPVILVQSAMRQCLARRKLNRLKELDRIAKAKRAALENESAKTIQRMCNKSCFRDHITVLIKNRRHRELIASCATKIQTRGRVLIAKEHVHQLRRSRDGLYIYAWIWLRMKGYAAKALLVRLQEEKRERDRHAAATILQSGVRRKLAYNEYTRRYRNKHAIAIQCMVRIKLAYLAYEQALIDKAHQLEKLRFDSATKIQSIARMVSAMDFVEEMREIQMEIDAADTIKALFKCAMFAVRLRRAMARRHASALKLQCASRIYLAEKVLRILRQDKIDGVQAIVIQSRARVWLERNTIKKKRLEVEHKERLRKEAEFVEHRRKEALRLHALRQKETNATPQQIFQQQKAKQRALQQSLAQQQKNYVQKPQRPPVGMEELEAIRQQYMISPGKARSQGTPKTPPPTNKPLDEFDLIARPKTQRTPSQEKQLQHHQRQLQPKQQQQQQQRYQLHQQQQLRQKQQLQQRQQQERQRQANRQPPPPGNSITGDSRNRPSQTSTRSSGSSNAQELLEYAQRAHGETQAKKKSKNPLKALKSVFSKKEKKPSPKIPPPVPQNAHRQPPPVIKKVQRDANVVVPQDQVSTAGSNRKLVPQQQRVSGGMNRSSTDGKKSITATPIDNIQMQYANVVVPQVQVSTTGSNRKLVPQQQRVSGGMHRSSTDGKKSITAPPIDSIQMQYALAAQGGPKVHKNSIAALQKSNSLPVQKEQQKKLAKQQRPSSPAATATTQENRYSNLVKKKSSSVGIVSKQAKMSDIPLSNNQQAKPKKVMVPGTPPIHAPPTPPISPVSKKAEVSEEGVRNLDYLSPDAFSDSDSDDSDSDSPKSPLNDEEEPDKEEEGGRVPFTTLARSRSLNEDNEEDGEAYLEEARKRSRSLSRDSSRGRKSVVKKDTRKRSSFDSSEEAAITEDDAPATIQIDIRKAAKREGPTYKLLWEGGLLGLRMKRDPDDLLPTVTKLTGKSAVIGIHLVDIGDGLVRVGDRDASEFSFTEAIDLLRTVEKPCTLEFQRAKKGPRDGPKTDGVLLSALALKLQAKIKENEEEQNAKKPKPPTLLYDQEFGVQWKQGALGMSLIGGKHTNLPQVTRITAKSTTIDVSNIEIGYFLTRIGKYHTEEGLFSDSIQTLQKARKPVMLYFCPSSTHQRPPLQANEYEFVWGKKAQMNFTLHESEAGSIVVRDVGETSKPTAKKKKPKKNAKKVVKLGDTLLYIDDQETSEISFKEALLTIRKGKRPITLRFRKAPKEKKRVKKATHTKSSSRITSSSPRQTALRQGSDRRTEKQYYGSDSDGSDDSDDSDDDSDEDDIDDSKSRARTKKVIKKPNVTKSKRSPKGKSPSRSSSASTVSSSASSKSSSSSAKNSPVKNKTTSSDRTSSAKNKTTSSDRTSSAKNKTASSDRTSSAKNKTASSDRTSSAKNKTASGDRTSSASTKSSSSLRPSSPRSSLSSRKSNSPAKKTKEPVRSSRKEASASRSVSPNPKRSSTASRSKTFRVVWRENESLGLTLKADENKRPMVGRLNGINMSEEMQKVRVGDILIAANGKEIKPSLPGQVKTMLKKLSTIERPATLIFKREGSNRDSMKDLSPVKRAMEYSYTWQENSRVNIVFAPHAETKAPVLSKANLKKDETGLLSLGDTLLAIDKTSLRGLSFSEVITLLDKASLPVVLKLKRKHRSGANPASE